MIAAHTYESAKISAYGEKGACGRGRSGKKENTEVSRTAKKAFRGKKRLRPCELGGGQETKGCAISAEQRRRRGMFCKQAAIRRGRERGEVERMPEWRSPSFGMRIKGGTLKVL